ncbi:T9SS C-terminal target domain-containing protein [Sesbania bispinosa]|nr:T9SS C-terminal target domain-containing protein [Sesbania bispinosa]
MRQSEVTSQFSSEDCFSEDDGDGNFELGIGNDLDIYFDHDSVQKMREALSELNDVGGNKSESNLGGYVAQVGYFEGVVDSAQYVACEGPNEDNVLFNGVGPNICLHVDQDGELMQEEGEMDIGLENLTQPDATCNGTNSIYVKDLEEEENIMEKGQSAEGLNPGNSEALLVDVDKREVEESLYLEDSRLCEVPIIEVNDVHLLNAGHTVTVKNAQIKKKQGGPRKVVDDTLVSRIENDSILNSSLLDLGPDKIAERVWQIGLELGVSTGDEELLMKNKLGEMEMRDRLAIGGMAVCRSGGVACWGWVFYSLYGYSVL